MRSYTQNEIVNLTKSEIESSILNNTFTFTLISKDLDKNLEFNAIVANYNITNDNLIFDFEIQIENEIEIKQVSILNIKSMKYFC